MRSARTTIRTTLLTTALAAATLLAPAASAFGPNSKPEEINRNPIMAETDGVGVDEHLDAQIPLDLAFTDETGAEVTLAKYFNGDKPVLLQLGYFGCPMLCGLVSQGMVSSLKELPLEVGKDFDVISVSINPDEKAPLAAGKKRNTVLEYGRPDSAPGFHFLTGSKENIDKLAEVVGFRYRYVPRQNEYAHAAVLTVATPAGRVSRYLYGVRYPQQTLRLSLVEASDNKIGSAGDYLMLLCYQYDASAGRYAPAAVQIMQAGGALTVLALGAILGTAFFREHRRRKGYIDAEYEAAAADRNN